MINHKGRIYVQTRKPSIMMGEDHPAVAQAEDDVQENDGLHQELHRAVMTTNNAEVMQNCQRILPQ